MAAGFAGCFVALEIHDAKFFPNSKLADRGAVRIALSLRRRCGEHDIVEQVRENRGPVQFEIDDSQEAVAHQSKKQGFEKARPEGD